MAQTNENVVSREKELLERQVTRRGGGQASREDQDQREEIEQTSKVSIPMEERLNKFRKVAAEAAAAAAAAENSTTQAAKPKIQRVPFMLRDEKNLDKYYEPTVIAIGPIHHGKARYEWGEKLKLRLAVNFGKDSAQNGAALLKKVQDNIKELRECYDEEATKDYDDDSLAWMLFIDGCSTLEFICKYDDLESFKIKRDQVAFAEQDMFLLENQLPYQLLTLLMCSSRRYEGVKKSIETFVQMHGVAPPDENQNSPQLRAEHVVSIEREPTHLLEHLRTRMLGNQPKQKSEISVNRRSQSFRNVQELQAAGIHFRHRKEPKVFGDIDFKSYICGGFLYLPKIKVDKWMGPKFMNLIAYEMCPDFPNDFGVTAYIGFLDSLIDHPDDVKHLAKKHILQNLIGSDEDVVQLFNEMGANLVPNYQIYCNIKTKIEDHYKTTWKIWTAQFFHDHFRSPWSILSFIGVLSGLGLSALQTWYTVNSNNPSSPCKRT